MLKNNFFKIATFFIALFLVSCGGDDETTLMGDWVEGTVFKGAPRGQVAYFEIDGKTYLVGGYNYEEGDFYNDTWQYDPQTKQWTQMDDFPGVARRDAVGFAVNGNGFVGTGFDGENKLNDFWKFDPTAEEQWTRIADFGGASRWGAVSFSIDSLGYVGTGYSDDGDKNDFWKYSPVTNAWTEIKTYDGYKRHDAIAFVINKKAYFGTGVNNGSYKEDFYVFDPVAEEWDDLADLDVDDSYSVIRSNAVAFVINGYGYVGTGYKSGVQSNFWKYDPSTDLWEEVTGFEGYARQDAISFVYENKGYVGTGKNASYSFDDFWVFDPAAEYDEDN
jgi:N-acetylneuraminic acid mutarotase